ncbi:GDSL esterase/lipase 7 [Ziziphus jujuba]|uniref:GDSL esterase/lipase 7 n=2 Tax=Ziziphus jujuba TaxID=326968 RepID=A0A6P6FZA4_ZIZJJ|nr:GDSL esterase/lipase 7 [Ziziphus jujuba]KAH7522046.1 hypothetical protein FEM48_Zijuj07G0096300 [Ziziphus jujuba var. spinosa]
MSSLSLYLQFLCFHLIVSVKSEAQLAYIAEKVPALFVFGDSIFDCGNKYSDHSFIKANYLPYGIDFPVPASGRYTNGRTIADFLSLHLNLSLSTPYSVVRDDKKIKITEGFNYASATAGILPDTGSELEGTMSLDKQIMLFKETVEEYLPQHFKNTAEISQYVLDSVFAILIGSNDYLGNYLNKKYNNATGRYNGDEFANLLISNLEKQLKNLYNLGARKILMFEIGPLGCTPLVVSKMKPDDKCVEVVNSMVTMFNGKLYFKLMDLTNSLKGLTFYLALTYRLLYDMVENPTRFGLKNSTHPCCVIKQNGGQCIPYENPCSERNLYVFWDEVHLTEAAYKIIPRKCFSDSSICFRINHLNVDGHVVISVQHSHRPNIIFSSCNFLFLTIIFLIIPV